MNRGGGFTWWLRSAIGLRPRWTGYVYAPPGWRWWHRFIPGRAVPAPPPTSFTGPPPWAMPPEDELGVDVPTHRKMAVSPNVVVAITNIVAFSTGFQVDIAVRRRKSRDLPVPPPKGRPPRPAEMTLELGITFADGRATTRSGHGPTPAMMDYYQAIREGREPALPAGPLISGWSGGGGGKRWDMRWWIWPLPPEGRLTVSCDWPEGDVPHAEVELDGGSIRRAGEESGKLWPDLESM